MMKKDLYAKVCVVGMMVAFPTCGISAEYEHREAENVSCRVNALDKDWSDWIIALLPPIATFAGIWFACKSAKIDQRITIAPCRIPIFILFSTLSDSLASAISKHENEAWTVPNLRQVADDWIYEFGKDDRRQYLESIAHLEKTSYGFARSDFNAIFPRVSLILNNGLFYFKSRDVRCSLEELLDVFAYAGSITTDPMSELDGTDSLAFNVAKVEKRFRNCATNASRALGLMREELTL